MADVAEEVQGPEAEFDPMSVDVSDALACRLDVPTYNSFAMSLDSSETEGGVKNWKRRGWKRLKSANPFMQEYRLPQPVVVADGYSTSVIAFTSSAILGVLDVTDPAELAKIESIKNEFDSDPMIDAIVASGVATRQQVEAEMTFRKFMGLRIIREKSETDVEYGMTFNQTIARSLSNVSTHPRKMFLGCNYRMEIIDMPPND
jgi:hypothetical protein